MWMVIEHLIFTRKNGKKYLHFGREIKENGVVIDSVKSLETKKRITMSELELIEFKNG